MARTTVATEVASETVAATARLLTARGETAIGVGLAGAYVNPDLTITEDRCAMIEGVTRLADEPVGAVVANAGGAAPLTVSVKCFDAVATLEGIRPLKAK